MRRRWMLFPVLGALVLALAVGLGVAYVSLRRQPAPWSASCVATVNGNTVRLDPVQARNAAIIAGVAGRRGLSPRAASIALATAYQESGLRNLDYGDRDSLGLFQQRPSQGWGTEKQIMDPWYASSAFYAAMVKVKGWENADIGDVAQAVQRSGYPDAYDKHVANARIVASALTGETPAAFTCTVDSSAADSAGLRSFLANSLPASASISGADGKVTVTAKDPRTAWGAASLAIADAGTHGVKSVTVGGRTWQRTWPVGASWSDAPAGDTTSVVIELA